VTSPIPGERTPVAAWIALAVAGVVGAVSSAVLVAEASSTGASSGGTTSLPAVTTPSTTAPVGSSSTTEPPAGSSEPAPSGSAVDPDCPPLFTVHFALGSADAVPTDLGLWADTLIVWLEAHPDAILLVDGHADSAGSEEGNLALSFRRAEAVVEVLVDRGGPTDRIQARGFGEYQAVVGQDPESDRNRRVTMQLEGQIHVGADCPVIEVGGSGAGDGSGAGEGAERGEGETG
jgi:outer membrane protein OmpA-like peptidoglycan-associated protein